MRASRLAAALAWLCLAPVAAESPAPLVVASVDAPAYELPLRYAGAEGFFSARGIAVRPEVVAKGVTALLVSGNADAALVSVAPVLGAFQNGADLKVLAFLFPRFDHYAVSRFRRAEAAGIRVVALNSAGAASRLLVDPFLEHLGLDPASVKAVVAPSDAARYALLERGAVDLVVVSAPLFVEKVRGEKRYELIPASAVGGAGEPSVLAASGRAVRERGAELAALVEALHAALRAAAAEKPKTIALLAREYGYPAAEAERFHQGLAAAVGRMDYVPSGARLEAALGALKELPPGAARDVGELAYPAWAEAAVARRAKR